MRLTDKYWVVGLWSMGLALAGCAFNKEDELYGDAACDASQVRYQADIRPIIANRCATPGCHVQGGGSFTLENYAQLKAKVDDGSFEQRVLVVRDMPPGGPLTDCQIIFIQEWVSRGAPND